MKNTKSFNFCEYCNKMWENVSPPTKEQYKNGFIKIEGYSSVLLNVKNGSHSAFLNGIYCDYKCLLKQIKKLLKIN